MVLKVNINIFLTLKTIINATLKPNQVLNIPARVIIGFYISVVPLQDDYGLFR